MTDKLSDEIPLFLNIREKVIEKMGLNISIINCHYH